MDTLFIDRKHAALTVEGNHLVIRHPEQRRLITAPLASLKSVILATEVSLCSKLLWQCAAHGISLVALHPREPKHSARLSACQQHGNVQRRLAQYRLCHDTALANQLANRLVGLRMAGMIRVLQQALPLRPALRLPLTLAINQLKAQRSALRQSPLPQASLLGTEGSAAASYFAAWGRLLPAEFGFSGRRRRPPPDAVNAALSLTFTLLANDIGRQLVAQGLDPMLGFYHQPAYGRDSLTCDVTEVFRHRAEAWIWRLFAEQTLTHDHFGQQGNACLLNKNGRAMFYQAWHRWRPRQQVAIKRIITLLVHHCDTTEHHHG